MTRSTTRRAPRDLAPLLAAATLPALASCAASTPPVAAEARAPEPTVELAANDAIARLVALDFDAFEQRFTPGSLAEALAMLVARKEEAGDALVAALPVNASAAQRETIASLALNQFRHRLDFPGYVAAAARLGEEDRPETRFWARQEPPSAAIPSAVVELDYADRKISGTVGGRPVTIVFDTGAPGVSADYALVAREGYPRFDGFESYSVIPAFGIRARQEATVISELTLGDAVLRNLPATTGKTTEEERARLKAGGLLSDFIFGLDVLAPFFAAVEIDQVAGKLRLYRDAPPEALPGRFVMGQSRYPISRIAISGKERNIIIDTGSANNSLPAEWLDGAPCGPTRTFERSWGSFTEKLVPARFGGARHDLWVTPRGFGKDELFDANGVIGVINRGRMVFDLDMGGFGLFDYDPALARYDYEPAARGTTCE